ncbi:hypothetical protein AC792_05985 [Arthrobacter sp. RIT-PI-e]|uniref:FKBP-type peptidyl-prolyl cis-trans isomerase n=1 Tax=Arthrobacter sp. RIT-PI-e TaxID=1681197 RepID=UPI0006A1A9B0|nr:FKBP-type peptidyl-prolyl cis-trans isomerase [Arthrobacter sp. RIT-PI-e]KNC19517.1 hypothetical protein AC792_05985 [Arthrobacter sp. RIT-PI-e]
MRKVLAILLPLLLLLTACGGAPGGSSEPTVGRSAGAAEVFDSFSVSGGSDDEAPTVEFDSPLDITATAAKAVVDGEGDEIQAGQQVRFKLLGLDANDGEVLGDTYANEAQVLVVDDQLQTELPDLYDVLVGTHVGAQVAYTEPAPEAPEGSESTDPLPSQILLLRIVSVEDQPEPLPEPEILPQEDVQRLDDDGQLPTFTFDDDGAPEVSIPDTEPSEDLVVKVLEEGDGDVLTEEDTISANYSGWTYSSGEQFDSSYERGEPSSFPLTGVITGWTNGLAGQKVGSKVLLVIPAPWAYGDPAPGGRPSGTLVFYVDIVSKDTGQ